MQDTSFSNSVATNSTNNMSIQNGQVNSTAVNSQSIQQQSTSIFSKNPGNSNINQSNSNSQGTGGIDNIFAGGGVTQTFTDTTSIFSGLNKGRQYALYSNKDYSYDVPKLTQEDIAAQKPAEGPKRTNPKAYNIDMTPKANPYEAFRNPDMQEMSFKDTISNAFSSIFNQKKAD